jgi:O-acetylserine/cysteine efflux transporter
MGVCVYGFVYLAIDVSSLISPIIIGSQLTIPFGLILSKFFLNETISFKKWFLILLSFIGIIIVSYDPKFGQEILGLIFVILMAFFYAIANILSRFLKNISTIDQIGWHSLIGFLVLLFLSFLLEANPTKQIYPLNFSGLLVAFHAGLFVSLIGHGGLFYLYKFYPVSVILPFYSLFPIFGLILTFLIFFEIPGIYEIIGGIMVITSVYLINKNDQSLKVLKQ